MLRLTFRTGCKACLAQLTADSAQLAAREGGPVITIVEAFFKSNGLVEGKISMDNLIYINIGSAEMTSQQPCTSLTAKKIDSKELLCTITIRIIRLLLRVAYRLGVQISLDN